MSEYVKKTLSVLLTNFLKLPLTILSGIFIARFLGPEGKGILVMIVLIATILKLISGCGFEFANVYFISKDKKRLDEILTNNIFVWLLSIVALTALAMFLKNFLLRTFLPNFDPLMFSFAVIVFPFLLWLSFALSIFQGLEKYKEFNLLKLAEPFTKLITIVCLVVFLKMGLFGGICSVTLSYLLPTILSFILLFKLARPKLSVDKRLLEDSIKYGLKGQIGLFFQFFNYRLDMFLVYYFLGINAVGFYTISVTIAELLWQIPNSVALTLFPRVSAKDKKSANEFTCKISRVSVSIMLVTAIICGLLSTYLIPVLYGSRFSVSIRPLQILLPGVIAFGIVKILTGYLHGRGKPQFGSIVTVCALLLTLVFGFYLIPKLGIIGAALATTIAYGFSLILTVFLFVKESELKLWQFLIPDFRDILSYFSKKQK